MNTIHPVLKTVTEVEGRVRGRRGSRLRWRLPNAGVVRTGVVTPSSKTLILSSFGRRRVLASWVRKPFNLDTQPLRGRVSWSRRRRSAQLRRAACCSLRARQ